MGRQFCEIDFTRADHLTGVGEKGFITELMPRFPIYVQMLPPDAREAIGKVPPQTAPARAMLEAEGLRSEGHVDIFDGGAPLAALSTSCASSVTAASCRRYVTQANEAAIIRMRLR